MKMLHILSLFTIAILFNSNMCYAYSAEDIMAFKRVSQVIPSDDGKQTAFVVYQVISNNDGKKWEYLLNLKDANNHFKILDQSDAISSVSWSPDNKYISYLSKGKNLM